VFACHKAICRHGYLHPFKESWPGLPSEALRNKIGHGDREETRLWVSKAFLNTLDFLLDFLINLIGTFFQSTEIAFILLALVLRKAAQLQLHDLWLLEFVANALLKFDENAADIALLLLCSCGERFLQAG
jgi:hypothetical protein